MGLALGRVMGKWREVIELGASKFSDGCGHARCPQFGPEHLDSCGYC